MQNSSLTILPLDYKYKSKELFPFSLGATGIFCIPTMKECKKYYINAKSDELMTTAHLSLCFAPTWLEENPDERSVFYWLSGKTTAKSNQHIIHLATDDAMPHQIRQKPVDFLHDPKTYWKVFDRNAERILSDAEWSVNIETKELEIQSIPSHVYQAAYLVYDVEPQGGLEHCYLNSDTPQFGAVPELSFDKEELRNKFFYIVNPVSLRAQDDILSKLEIFLKEWGDCIDLLRVLVSCRYTTYIDSQKLLYGGWDENGEKITGWNWYGYGRFVHPDNQIKFKETTGVEFDVNWFLTSKYGQIKYPPTLEYLKWVHFINDEIIKYHAKISRLCKEYNVKLQANIGDNWIGVEPYIENFAIPEFDSIAMYGLGKAVANRMLTDFISRTKRILKIWFASEAGSTHYEGPLALEKLRSDWRNSRKAFFFKLPDELRLEILDENATDSKKSLVAQIVNEFNFYKKFIGGCKVYRHSINIYILNCWGNLRAWTGWGDDAGESQNIIQTHLLNMPFNIKWLSLCDVSDKGIPEDCDLIFNFGPQGTSWNGDYMWGLPGVKSKIESFVKNGGGFLGIDAPAFYNGSFSLAFLSDMFGQEEDVDAKLTLHSEKAYSHWISKDLPETIDVKRGLKIKLKDSDAALLYTCNDSPVVYVKEAGRGRVGYINGYSNSPEYYKLLKKMFFWLSRKETLSEKLHTPNADVFLYFYKQEKILIVYNMSNLCREVELQFDMSLLGETDYEKISFYDMAGERYIADSSFSCSELKKGIKITIAEWDAKFLKMILVEK